MVGDPYFSFQNQILFTIISTLSKNDKNNIWQRTLHFKDLIEMFLGLQTLWPYLLKKPDFFRFRVFFRACSLQNEVGDPPFLFYISDITNSSSYSGKSNAVGIKGADFEDEFLFQILAALLQNLDEGKGRK